MIIRFATYALFFVAAAQFINSLFIFQNARVPSIFFDCITNFLCAFIVRRFHSRIASLIALTLASANLFLVFSHPAILSVILAFVATLASMRALEATLKLHGRLAPIPTSSFTIKNIGIAVSAISCVLVVLYFMVAIPPSSAEKNMMRHMQADMRAILNRDKVKILRQGSIFKFGLVSIAVVVSQEGWGTILKPGTEEILSDRRWIKHSGQDNVFCKDGVQLNFTSVMNQGKGAVEIDIFYDNLSRKNCSS